MYVDEENLVGYLHLSVEGQKLVSVSRNAFHSLWFGSYYPDVDNVGFGGPWSGKTIHESNHCLLGTDKYL